MLCCTDDDIYDIHMINKNKLRKEGERKTTMINRSLFENPKEYENAVNTKS